MFNEESGIPMWREWRTTISQRSLEIIVHGECAVEADRRNAGKKVSTQLPCSKLWKNRHQPVEKIKELGTVQAAAK
jgi:hypothetical protein